jgi:hypothetical protein
MVNHFMDKFIIQVIVATKCVSEHVGTGSHVVSDFWGKSLAASVGNYLGSDSIVTVWAMTLQESQHSSFIYATTSLYLSLTLILVHEASLTAYESFINFYFTRHLVERLGLHCQPDTMKHERSGLLSNTDCPADLILMVNGSA